jgi:hypothetical protein
LAINFKSEIKKKNKIKKNLVSKDICLNQVRVQEAIDELRGAVTIVYPMGLPPYEPIQMEFENKEELEGTQVSHSCVVLTYYLVIYIRFN